MVGFAERASRLGGGVNLTEKGDSGIDRSAACPMLGEIGQI